MTDDRDNTLDDLFEPFELPETPPERDEPIASPRPDTPAPATTEFTATATIPCPSCGSTNPDYNRHCEQCGARLSQDPLPVAPPPMSRTSPGGRALGVLAAVVLVVALIALVFNVFRGGGDDQAAASTSTSSTTSTIPPVVTELFASSVEASSELAGWEAANLIDGDPATSWNDEGLRGKGAWLVFRFPRPVALKEIAFQNLEDEVRFKRNYKIQGFSIVVDDLAVEINDRLENSNAEQRVQVASLETTEVRVNVLSTYTAEPAGDQPPFDELALQGVRFFGTER